MIYRNQIRVRAHESGEYKKYAYDTLYRQSGVGLLQALMSDRLPATVDIKEEKFMDEDWGAGDVEVVRLSIDINPVQYRYMEFPVIDDVAFIGTFSEKDKKLEQWLAWALFGCITLFMVVLWLANGVMK